MDRRNFIRLTGGGAILGATSGMAACTSRYPDAAIEAWQGPGSQADPRRWIVAHAILAPHSHNLQSWQVDLQTPGEITLRCDLERLLPQTDPFSRQIMMSHGTFLELLDLAAREQGLRADIELFPQGAFAADRLDGRPVARVRLSPDAGIQRDPLFAQILHRRTNREVYDARAVAPAAWQAMALAAKAPQVHFGHLGPDQAAPLQQQRDIASRAWKTELTTPRTILESYDLLRIGADEVRQHRDGLALMDPMIVVMDRLGLFDRTEAPAPDSFATRSQLEQFDAKLASTQQFLWLVSDGNDRVTQVNAGRAYARVQLAATAHGVVMHPLQQALQEYPEQAENLAAIHRLLQAPPGQQTVQMWARVGHAPAVQPAPRRALDAIIRS